MIVFNSRLNLFGTWQIPNIRMFHEHQIQNGNSQDRKCCSTITSMVQHQPAASVKTSALFLLPSFHTRMSLNKSACGPDVGLIYVEDRVSPFLGQSSAWQSRASAPCPNSTAMVHVSRRNKNAVLGVEQKNSILAKNSNCSIIQGRAKVGFVNRI